MDETYLEVKFHEYCEKCEHKDVDEEKEPCNECLSHPYNTYSHKPLNYKGQFLAEDSYGDFTRIGRIKPYLYLVDYDYINYDNAKLYYKKNAGIEGIGGCSSVKCGNFYGRHLDWFYNEQAEFVVRTPRIGNRYASIGVAGGLSALTDKFVRSLKPFYMYKIIPFQLYDGINECGLVANMNVVPLDKTNTASIPFIEKREEISGVMLIRYILDRFSNAKDAVEYIRDYVSVYFPKALRDLGYGLHYMIGDRHSTYILEFVDNRAKIFEDKTIMTNFFIDGVTFNIDGTVYTPETQSGSVNAITTNHITPNGSGLERYNYIVQNYDTASTKYGMRELMNGLMYTKAYSTSPNPSNPYWYTEFVGSRGLTCGNPASDYREVVNIAGGYYTNRSRDDGGKTWHTVHSSVYDIEKRRLYLITQEDEDEYVFEL